ncbi:MAG TPA: hypothetical protein PLU85_09755 [Bacteroidia bacterium]|nr:MAG: hypothetical protein IPJ93_09950 [Bacteroidota bacterium]HQW19009.1 hypothetical protein [Bacteroidia bacterium]HRA60731.1 hypothetical protein [Bacteroidia bacterium]HRB26264.1 hypothetical protein [Bacteroidia bacterium]HRC35391.1 hypothetical protein [Bacteroidia bacterium]
MYRSCASNSNELRTREAPASWALCIEAMLRTAMNNTVPAKPLLRGPYV